jgi:hypothetical protein
MISLSRDRTKQLTLKNEFPLLVLLTGLVRLIVLPPNTLIALLAMDISHHVSTRSHIPLRGFTRPRIDHRAEEICFSMLAAEVSRDDVVLGGEMCLALITAEDLGRVQVDVVGETHGGVQHFSGSGY